MPTTEAWARWAVPKASFTYSSARDARRRANPASFASSSGWNRRFSRRSASPARSASAIFAVPSETQSSAIRTFAPRSPASRPATGARLMPGTTRPFGRPRCEAMIGSPPRSRISFRVGREARMRVSSATPPSRSGTLKSTRTNTLLP